MKTPAHPHGISVEVAAEYVPAQSGEDCYAFAYHVTIHNAGKEAARLISRCWVITNGTGDEQEIHGQGVVGEQPRLVPDETFRYSSSCMLETPVGTMRGSYLMETDDGRRFEVDIPTFMLAMPRVLH